MSSRSIIVISIFTLIFTLFGEWIGNSAYRQLREEGVDDQLSKGRLFIPSMSKPEWEEPRILLFKRDQNFRNQLIRTRCEFGKSTFLNPGHYTIIFGSAEEQTDMIQMEFDIVAGGTKILQPKWASLLVKVIDDNREEIRIGYDIYSNDQEIKMGSKYSIDKTDFQKQHDTWILKPGKYKIVKSGEPFNTIINFGTIELKEGDLTQVTIVVDSDTKDFRGFGELTGEDLNKESQAKWQERITLKGSFSLNSDNFDNEDDSNSEANFNGRIKNQLKYDVKPWLINLDQTFETDFRKGNEEDIQILNDKLDLSNTAIYYLTDIFGIYGELSLKSEIFSDNVYFSSERDIRKVYSAYIEDHNQVRDIEVSPALFPLTTGEEIGLNFHFLNTPSSNLYIRTGIGMEQTNNNKVFEETGVDENYTIYTELKDKYINGFVFSAGSDLRILSNLNYDGEVRFIKSFTESDEYSFNWENSFTFNILQYLSLEYNLDFHYSDQREYLAWRHNLLLEFSYYFSNY